MLCRSCTNWQSVEAKEQGVIYDRCMVFKKNITDLGTVTKCTAYDANDLPYLFHMEAWVLKEDTKGVLRLHDPQGNLPKWSRGKKKNVKLKKARQVKRKAYER